MSIIIWLVLDFILGLLFGVIVAALCSAGRIAPMTVALARFAYFKNWRHDKTGLWIWFGGGSPVEIARDALNLPEQKTGGFNNGRTTSTNQV